MALYDLIKSGKFDVYPMGPVTNIDEMYQADKALFYLHLAEPGSAEWDHWFAELFDGHPPEEVTILLPVKIDFPKRITFGKRVFISYNFKAMSIGGIEIGNDVQIGPNVTIMTDDHDLIYREVPRCKPVVIGNDVRIGAQVTILPGVHVGDGAVLKDNAVVNMDVPAGAVVECSPDEPIHMSEKEGVTG